MSLKARSQVVADGGMFFEGTLPSSRRRGDVFLYQQPKSIPPLKGNYPLQVEYELALEEVFKKRKELSGVCQYHRDTLPHDVMRQSLLAHKTLVINDTVTKINPHYLRSTADPNTNAELDKMIAVLCGMR
jgi:hypothetical protein